MCTCRLGELGLLRLSALGVSPGGEVGLGLGQRLPRHAEVENVGLQREAGEWSKREERGDRTPCCPQETKKVTSSLPDFKVLNSSPLG